ncbi:MAG: phytanoyl-CoA dioxygenase family protein, partial [Pseudomonadota bacterium]
YSALEIERERTFLNGLLAQFERDGRDAYDINAYQDSCRNIYDMVTHPLLLDYVEDLIGPDIVCWGSHYFCKLPEDSREVPFHQDAPYWPFRPNGAVTAWIAIDDVHPDAGPMCFLPGSHLQGRLEWQRRSDNVVLELEVKETDSLGGAVPLLMQAGHVSLHTDLLVHGSAANTSRHRRCGFTARYTNPQSWIKSPEHAAWTRSAILCRGEDRSGRWPHNERPNATHFDNQTTF